MNPKVLKTMFAVIIILSMIFQPQASSAQSAAAWGPIQQEEEQIDPPGHPLPENPIPSHRPGHRSNAMNYTKTVTVTTADGVTETKELAGLDAITSQPLQAAAGATVDPLAGNYTLVRKEQVITSGTPAHEAQATSSPAETTFYYQAGGLMEQANAGKQVDSVYHDIAAGDLNNDGIDEQVVASSVNGALYLNAGGKPGLPGAITSAPAAAIAPDQVNAVVFVRGFDNGLYVCVTTNPVCSNRGRSAILLSAPAVVQTGTSAYDIYAVLSNHQIYRTSFNASKPADQAWSAWTSIDDPSITNWPDTGTDAPAVAASGGRVELFRLGPDQTLYWRHFDGAAWSGWQSEGGMLASMPRAVVLPNGDVQVVAVGVDNTLWTRTYQASGSWGSWKEIVPTGLAQGVMLASAPALVLDSAVLEVYVTGSDNQLWGTQVPLAGATTSAWKSGGGVLDSSIAAVKLPGVSATAIFAKTRSGKLQQRAGSAWSDIVNGVMTNFASFSDGLPAVTRVIQDKNPDFSAPNDYQDYTLDVETGYIYGNGRRQVVVARARDASHVTIDLYDTSDTPTGSEFRLERTAFLDISHPVDYFRIATGDFVGKDGIDEIALAYVSGAYYAVDIIKQTGTTTPTLDLVSTGQPVEAKGSADHTTDKGPSVFAGTLQVAAGDFNADGQDEAAVNMVWKWNDWQTTPSCTTWRYLFMTRVYNFSGAAKPFSQAMHYPEEYAEIETAYLTDLNSVATAMAAGDINGDGRDELVRTWPVSFAQVYIGCVVGNFPVMQRFNRKLQVLTLPANAGYWNNPQLSNVTAEDIYNAPETHYSYGDRLAVWDVDTDLQAEIAFQEAIGKENLHDEYNPSLLLRIFKYAIDQQTNTGTYYQPAAQAWIGWKLNSHLVSGSFTGDNKRVGKPSYRIQNRVDSLVAVVNAPPVHHDVVKKPDGSYVVINSEATTGSSSAVYSATKTDSTALTMEAKHAFTLGAGLEQGLCIGFDLEKVASAEACVNRSIKYTYGMNFEYTTKRVQSISFKQNDTASTDDKVIFYGTAERVWEYPVLDDSTGTPKDYITVVFPIEQVTNQPATLNGFTQGSCDEEWYNAGHQPNNVWSYDSFQTPTWADYKLDSEEGGTASHVFAKDNDGGGASTILFSDFSLTKSSSTITHKLEVGADISTKAKVNFELFNVSSSLKASFQGKYDNSTMNSDEISAGSDIQVSATLGVRNTDYAYTTRVIDYWSRGGYQVLNYQTSVGSTNGWTTYYSRSDPAFVLPWYGFPSTDTKVLLAQNPVCGELQKLWSPDLKIKVQGQPDKQIRLASVGDKVTISAKVRNYSNVAVGQNVTVRFYLGVPQTNGANAIGETTISNLTRDYPQTATLDWTVAGRGKNRIYAVIDPDNAIQNEVHERGDLIDNNVAYTILNIGAGTYNDSGKSAQKPYQGVAYNQGAGSLNVAFFSANTSLAAVTRFNLGDSAVSTGPGTTIGSPFALTAYQGDNNNQWNKAIPNFIVASAGSVPSAIVIDYGSAGLTADQQNKLAFFQQTDPGASWQLAPNGNCGAGYSAYTFPEIQRVVIPVCKTANAFALAIPGHTTIYLPLVRK